MQCSVCQHEMVPSKIGALCPNCGHFEPAAATSDLPAAGPAKITLGSTAPSSDPIITPPEEPAREPLIIPASDPDPIPAPDADAAPQAASTARLVINPPEHDPEPPAEPTITVVPEPEPTLPVPQPDLSASADLISPSEVPPSVDPIIPPADAAPSQPAPPAEPMPEPTPEPEPTLPAPPLPETTPPTDPPPPIGLKLPTEPLPPAPATTADAAAGSNVMPGLPADTNTVQAASPKKKWLVPLIAVVAVLVLGGGALAYKMFVFDPQQAPAAYLQKLFSAKTGQFSAVASYSSPQDASSLITGDLSLTADGSYDVTSPQTPKSDIKLAVKYSGSSLGGEIITLPKTAYFKITQLGFLSSLGVSLSNAWYKYPISSESSTSSNDCTTKHSKSGSLFGLSFPSSLPLKHASRVGLFTSVDGHSTTHFSGDVNMSKLQSYVDAANAQLPADCKISLDASTVKNTTVHYDIWRGSDFDRSSFTVTTSDPKSAINLTLDSKGYNQPVSIQAPANAKSLDSLLSSFDDSTSSLDGSSVGPAASSD